MQYKANTPRTLRTKLKPLVAVMLPLLVYANSHTTLAADIIWNGSIDNNWFEANNWDMGRAPINTDKVVLVNGAINIQSAGAISNDAAIAINSGTHGTMAVSGASSTWINSGLLNMGSSGGNGSLNINTGATVSNTTASINGGSSVTVSDSGTTWTNNGSLLINTGNVTINTGATVNVTSGAGTTLATYATQNGTLNIGTGGVAGILNSGSVYGGGGTATLNFNHNDTNYFFTRDGTSSGAEILLLGSGLDVNQIGTGKTILTADNTYGGTTTISAGTLQIGNDGTTGTLGSGNVTNNSALIFNRSDATSYAGDISGSGTVTKQGAGTLTLSGSNSYTGATTVNAGTLSVSSDNNLGTGSITLNGGNLAVTGTTTIDNAIVLSHDATITNSENATLSGVISGANTLTKTGASTLTLSGANTYSGGTTISAGTLQVSANNQLGSGTITLDGGTLRNTAIASVSNAAILNTGTSSTIDNADSLAFQGVISGNGNLTKTGAGDLAFAGSNTYTGTTTISAGLLQIGGGGTSGAIAGNIINNSELLFFRSNAYAHSGDISGTGSITKLAAGTATITGALTHTGGTTISGGTFEIGNGGTTGSITGNITNNSSLIFNRSDAVTFGDVISGSGTFTQSGTGNTKLTGVNTYSGSTTINAGTLSINGSILNSATTVNSGGTLGGSGTVGNVIVNSGGTFAPGNSIGTMNVTGNVIFNTGSNYNVEVDAAGNTDKIIATGTATLTGATVNVLPESGTYSYATDYTILTATGGLGGTEFASVNSNFAFLTPTLSYDANNVFLNLTRNDVSFSNVAKTPNQTAVSVVIENNMTALQTIVSNITPLSDTAAQQAFDSLSGVQHTHNQAVISKLSLQFQNLLFNHSHLNTAGSHGLNTQHASAIQRFQVADNSDSWQRYLAESLSSQRHWWIQGLGHFGSIDDSANAHGADYQSGGLVFGIDTTWHDYIVGLAGSYVHTHIDAFTGDSDIDSFQTGAFARWQEDNIYLNTSIGLGIHNVDATRTIILGSSINTASSDYDSVNLSTALETGQHIKLDEATTFTPYAGISYSHNSREAFNEHGAGVARLNIDEQHENSLRSSLGLRLSRDLQTNNHTVITPALNLAYIHEFLDDTAELEAGFAGVPNTHFKVDGSKLNRNRLLIGLSATGQLSESTTLNISYGGEIAGSDDNHSVAATIKFVM